MIKSYAVALVSCGFITCLARAEIVISWDFNRYESAITNGEMGPLVRVRFDLSNQEREASTRIVRAGDVNAWDSTTYALNSLDHADLTLKAHRLSQSSFTSAAISPV